MTEQTINYGEAMFKDIKPKEVLAGVKDAAASWWNEFSPGTVAKGDVEAFDRVVGRIKNEDLRKKLQDNKTFIRVAGYVQGSVALAVDAAVATVPWYLKFRRERNVDRPNIIAEANKKAPSRVFWKRMGREEYTYEGSFAKGEEIDKALEYRPWYRRMFDPFGEDPDARPYVNYGNQEARKVLRKLVEEDIRADKGVGFKSEVKKDIVRRIRSHDQAFSAKIVGLAGVEAGVFAFRPATRLAKLQTKAGEAVGSWVVDHIVNNIVKGPNPVS